MLQRLRHRAGGQEGFTLIELLVVILIIGILAAVAIPTFLGQTNKANDSNAQAMVQSAETAEMTYWTDNEGKQFLSCKPGANPDCSQLASYENTLKQATNLTADSAAVQVKGAYSPAAGDDNTNSFDVYLTSSTKIIYGMTRDGDGSNHKWCVVPAGVSNAGGCTVTVGLPAQTDTPGTW